MPDQQNTVLNNASKISTNTILLWVVFILLPALFFHPASADIYKWVDQNGKTHFTDTPPEKAFAKKLKLKINSFSSSSASPFKYDPSLISTRKKNKEVVMYSASWCGVCKTAKKYFKNNKIQYTEHDIDTSTKGKKDFKKLNGKGVPIILVGDQRMNGFTASGFNQMYKR